MTLANRTTNRICFETEIRQRLYTPLMSGMLRDEGKIEEAEMERKMKGEIHRFLWGKSSSFDGTRRL